MSETDAAPEPAPRPPVPWGQKVAAAAVHVLLSATAIGALLLVATTAWYPDQLFSSDGGWQGLRIVLLVDLVLGPALTFVVFRRGKPGLVTDLALIAALQVAAFGGGAWILWDERPLALVFVDGSFYSVSRDDFQIADVPVPDLSDFPDDRPHAVHVDLPTDLEDQNEIRGRLFQRRQPMYTHAPLYRPLTARDRWILDAALTREQIARGGDAGLTLWLDGLGVPASRIALFPYVSRFGLHFMAIDRADLSVLGIRQPAPGYRFEALPIRSVARPREETAP